MPSSTIVPNYDASAILTNAAPGTDITNVTLITLAIESGYAFIEHSSISVDNTVLYLPGSTGDSIIVSDVSGNSTTITLAAGTDITVNGDTYSLGNYIPIVGVNYLYAGYGGVYLQKANGYLAKINQTGSGTVTVSYRRHFNIPDEVITSQTLLPVGAQLIIDTTSDTGYKRGLVKWNGVVQLSASFRMGPANSIIDVTFFPNNSVIYSQDGTTLLSVNTTYVGEFVIPQSVVAIGPCAFARCYDISSVSIPSSVTTIGAFAFYSCSALTSIVIPNSVTSVGIGAFQDCIAMTSASISTSLEDIGDSVFEACESLTSITIPWGVKTLGVNAFSGCSNVSSVSIPGTVLHIGENALSGLTLVSQINIPVSVETIGINAFSGCRDLTSIIIPPRVTSIGAYAFSNCQFLTSILFMCLPLNPVTSQPLNIGNLLGSGSGNAICYYNPLVREWIGPYSVAGTLSLATLTTPTFRLPVNRNYGPGHYYENLHIAQLLYSRAFFDSTASTTTGVTTVNNFDAAPLFSGLSGTYFPTVNMTNVTLIVPPVVSGSVSIDSSTISVGTSVLYFPGVAGESISVTDSATGATTSIYLAAGTDIIVLSPFGGTTFSLGSLIPIAGKTYLYAGHGSVYLQKVNGFLTILDQTGSGTVTITRQSDGATVSSQTLLSAGDVLSVAAQPAAGYSLTSLRINGSSRTTFTVGSANVSIEVVFSGSGVVCFLADAPVLTPSGYKTIGSLKVGDLVMTADGSPSAIQKVKVQHVSPSAETNPYSIPKGQFGATRRLLISPNHKVLVAGRGLVEARKLGLEQKSMTKSFEYYNLELESWKNMVVAGVIVESLAPKRRFVLSAEEFRTLVLRNFGRITPEVQQRLREVSRVLADGRVEFIATVQR